jgi:hypothetical protein
VISIVAFGVSQVSIIEFGYAATDAIPTTATSAQN